MSVLRCEEIRIIMWYSSATWYIPCFSMCMPIARNECEALPCLNGGVCVDSVEKFVCQCITEGPVTYMGERCENGIIFVFVLHVCRVQVDCAVLPTYHTLNSLL